MLARQFQKGEPRILFVPKARRMRLSWLMVACHTHLALWSAHSNVFIVSSKAEKSAELVERAHGILARLPAVGGGGRVVARTHAPPMIRLDNGSMIMGVAEGADQLRGYTGSAVLCDEFGTWQWPREAYSALCLTHPRGWTLDHRERAALPRHMEGDDLGHPPRWLTALAPCEDHAVIAGCC